MATTATPATRASATPVAAGDGTTQVVFGINFDINGKAVPVTTVVGDPTKEALEFTLPEPIDLGTIKNFVTWFNDTFSTNLPDADSFPAPLNQIFGKLEGLDFTVLQFHVRVPPSSEPNPSTQYTFALSAMWKGEGLDLIPKVLSIQGATFGLTNEHGSSPDSGDSTNADGG